MPVVPPACPHRERQCPRRVTGENRAAYSNVLLHGSIVSAENIPWSQRTAENKIKTKSPESSFPSPDRDIQLITNLCLSPPVPWAPGFIPWLGEEAVQVDLGRKGQGRAALAGSAPCPAHCLPCHARGVTHSHAVPLPCISRGPS